MKVILENAKVDEKNTKEENMRKIVFHVLIDKGLGSALNKPCESNILESCNTNFTETNKLLAVLKGLITSQVFPLVSPLLRANELIKKQQYY